jgi:hypothetical protein
VGRPSGTLTSGGVVDVRDGLSGREAARRLASVGPNALPQARRRHPGVLLVKQLTHFFAVLLWVAAGLAAVAGMPVLAVAIVVVIAVNGGFAFVQEYRADRPPTGCATCCRSPRPCAGTGSGTPYPPPNWSPATWCCWRPATGSARTCGWRAVPGWRWTSRC